MVTIFNFKSQVCTSVDQSRRLLELGLKKETADMCYKVTTHDFKGNEINEKDRHYTLCCWYNESSLVSGLERKKNYPCLESAQADDFGRNERLCVFRP